VWDPHTQANINKVESIQRRAARFVTNNYDPRASVTTLLQDLNWPTGKDEVFGVVDDLKLLAVDIIICHDLITLVGDA
jgi:hypothetical protein